MGPVTKVILAVVAFTGLLVGGAFLLRKTKKDAKPKYEVTADDSSVPPIRALPANVEQMDAFGRREDMWSTKELLARDLFGMRGMWRDGFIAGCHDDKLIDGYLKDLDVRTAAWTASIDVKGPCLDKLNAWRLKPMPVEPSKMGDLYNARIEGAWFDEAEGKLRALHKGKRYSVRADEPDAVAILIRALQ